LAYGSGYSSQATSSALFSSPLSHKPTREKVVSLLAVGGRIEEKFDERRGEYSPWKRNK
jgi:hypothetical protein